jgi:hypothetical protein
MARQVRVNAMSFSIIVRMLTEGACSYDELATETGLHRQVCAKVVAHLKGQERAYISEWGLDNRGAHVVKMFRFTLTPKKDVPRPPPQSSSVTNKKARAKLRAMRMIAAMAGQPMTCKQQKALIKARTKRTRNPGQGRVHGADGKFASLPTHEGAMA